MNKFFLFFIGFFLSSLYAHQTGLSYVNIVEDSESKISVIYKKPLGDTKANNISLRFPIECVKVAQREQSVDKGFIINNYNLWCGKEGLLNSRVWVEGLISTDRGVLIRYKKGDIIDKSLLRSATPFIYINYESSNLELSIEYIKLGIVHILTGFDHLSFVFALLLLAFTNKHLLFAITAFTASHSITLVCGVLGIIRVDVLYVEAMIALSIVFLARELVVDNRNSLSRKYLGIVAFIFGLLHGFGFSSSLATIGLPQEEIPLSLFSFNLGIEIGQLLFIAFMSIVLFIVRKYIISDRKKLDIFIAYCIGTVSSFWLIERVLSF